MRGHEKCRRCAEPTSTGGSKPRFWCSRQCADAHCADMEAKNGCKFFECHGPTDLSEVITESEFLSLTPFSYWPRASVGRAPTMADVEYGFWELAAYESCLCSVCDRVIDNHLLGDESDVCGRHCDLQEYRVNGKLMTRHDLARLLRVRPYEIEPAFNGVRGRGDVPVALLGKLLRDAPVFEDDSWR